MSDPLANPALTDLTMRIGKVVSERDAAVRRAELAWERVCELEQANQGLRADMAVLMKERDAATPTPLGNMKKKQHNFSDYLNDPEGKLGLIPANLGEGFKWVHERQKHRYCTRLTDYHFYKGKRRIRLNLTSYAGFSIGAMHYYASLQAPSAECYNLTKKTGGHGGYVGVPESNPRHRDIGRQFSLDVKRRLTKVEKDMGGTPLGKIGEFTLRFNTEAEAKAAAIVTFKKRFAPGWVLLANDTEGDEIVFAET